MSISDLFVPLLIVFILVYGIFKRVDVAEAFCASENGRLSFSPSSLQTYLHCPRQYFYQYVMGLPPVDQIGRAHV